MNDQRFEEALKYLQRNAPTSLPDFGFKPCSGGWESTTRKKISGELCDNTTSKVYWYTDRYFCLVGYKTGDKTTAIRECFMQEYGLSKRDAYHKILKLAGMELPKTNGKGLKSVQAPEPIVQVAKPQVDQHLLKDILEIAIKSLSEEKAKPVRDYLIKERKFTPEDIDKMQAGYLDWEAFNQAYDLPELVNAGLKNHPDHPLVIPWRDEQGNLQGLSFKVLKRGVKDKVRSTVGFPKRELLYNAHNSKNKNKVLVVEGEFDALKAFYGGVDIDNVVALGGCTLYPKQLEILMQHEEVVLCLDGGEEGQEGIEKAITQFSNAGFADHVFVVRVPDGLDVDDYIRAEGIPAFNDLLCYMEQPCFMYLIDRAAKEPRRLLAKDKLSASVRLNFRDKCTNIVESISTLHDLKKVVDEIFLMYGKYMPTTITAETFIAEIPKSKEEQRKKEEEQQKINDLKDVTHRVSEFIEKGQFAHAQVLLEQHQERTQLYDSVIDFKKEFFTPQKEGEVRADILKMPQGLNSGYTINGKDLLIPYGGLSIIAAKTGHGKTALLNNLAVNFVKDKGVRVWMFGYEMTSGQMQKNIASTYIGKNIIHNSQLAPKHPELRTAITHYLHSPDSGLFDKDTKDFLKEHYGKYEKLVTDHRLIIRWGTWSADELIAIIHAIHGEYTDKQNIFIVDYLQLLRSNASEKRHEQIKVICGSLAQTATRLLCPIILGAQFNREGKSPSTMRLEYLGEGGEIERSADLILALFNNNKLDWEDSFNLAKPGTGNNKNSEIPPEFIKQYIQQKDTLYAEILKTRGENKEKGVWYFDESTGVIRDRITQGENDTTIEQNNSIESESISYSAGRSNKHAIQKTPKVTEK